MSRTLPEKQAILREVAVALHFGHDGVVTRDQRFRPKHRLHLKRDFAHVYARRCRAENEWLAVYAASNGLPYSRLGLSTGRRVGNAAQRNRVKRLLREAFRKRRDEFPPGFDYICVPKPAAVEAPGLGDALVALMIKAARRADPNRRDRKG